MWKGRKQLTGSIRGSNSCDSRIRQENGPNHEKLRRREISARQIQEAAGIVMHRKDWARAPSSETVYFRKFTDYSVYMNTQVRSRTKAQCARRTSQKAPITLGLNQEDLVIKRIRSV